MLQARWHQPSQDTVTLKLAFAATLRINTMMVQTGSGGGDPPPLHTLDQQETTPQDLVRAPLKASPQCTMFDKRDTIMLF